MVALLPIKGNSERVPGKNFKEFRGKPLFLWILETLLKIDRIELIVINTDVSEKFKRFDLHLNSRIMIRERAAEIRGDHVSMNKVIQNDIGAVKSDNYLMTHTTNPLISAETINTAINKYYLSTEEGFDSLFSVNQFKSRFYTSDLKPLNHNPDDLIRTQDLKPIYEENSCLYLFNNESFKSTKARIGRTPNILVTPYYESVDIDDYESWQQAEIFSTLYNN